MAKTFVEQAAELHEKVLGLVAERDQLKNQVTELEISNSVLVSQNNDLRELVRKANAERDRFLKVATCIVTNVTNARKAFIDAVAAAEAEIKNAVPLAAPPLPENLERQIAEVVKGLERINPAPKTMPTDAPPSFLMREQGREQGRGQGVTLTSIISK